MDDADTLFAAAAASEAVGESHVYAVVSVPVETWRDEADEVVAAAVVLTRVTPVEEDEEEVELYD